MLNPMDFISIDLVGPFETTVKGNQYALTVIYMLTNYIICIPIPDKSTDKIVNVHLQEVYCKLRGSLKILSDTGSEFKNSIFSKRATCLVIKHSFIFIPIQALSQQMYRSFTLIA